MKSNNTTFIHQTTKAALITTVALTLMLPAGLANAAVSSSSATGGAMSSAPATATTSVSSEPAVEGANPSVPADPAKVKFTKEQAIAKLKELFPTIKDATVSNVELGINNTFPVPEYQMVWSIQWQYQVGERGYGFSSQVDAITGDIISTYLSIPGEDNQAYYPPEFTEAQALEKAKEFIGRAAPSLKSTEIVYQNNNSLYSSGSTLFGPVNYNFSFKLLKNGIPSASNALMITVDGSGNITQFNKSVEALKYPSGVPAILKEQAEKKYDNSFDLGLYYVPLRNMNGAADKWILAWRPMNEALYSIDAQNGKYLDNTGTVIPGKVVFSEVPQGKDVFKPADVNRELTAEEAVKRVQQVATIPAARKLTGQSLGGDYSSPAQQVWRLNWEEPMVNFASMAPSRSYAEVDALTGEIRQFQLEQNSYLQELKPQSTAGAKKLTAEEAKQKAFTLVNKMYDKAASTLKLADYGADWSLAPDDAGYRYEFVRYYNGIPVSEGNVSVRLDLYGNLLSYTSSRSSDIDKFSSLETTPTVSREQALAEYKSQYMLELQYRSYGGYMGIGGYTSPSIKLVYTPTAKDVQKSIEVLSAITGKWVAQYGNLPSTSQVSVLATDIKDHPAEKALAELVKYNLLPLDAEGKVNPNEEITAGDWLNMLVKASNPYYSAYNMRADNKAVAGVNPEDPNYDALVFALERQWISKDSTPKLDGKLSREQLAVLLSSFLKYSKLSAYLSADEAVAKLSDVSQISNKGAVAIAMKLELLKAEDGKFNPQQNVTKAQAASIIMKLVELQGRTDQTIGQ
ncbi:S-layer homology domain-containing protein [Paenibacillus donghaensis]|uniref:SLH domain-containing protein n=1 Tax=Paenibacillus donghaensis TaxID=414771 RepID=A0A2Z2KAZ8_9BACL|nr:YcdB/YcdC domain-containing protein [Paenibacillus donghaensis]ASA23876.1 hypothetical protein B9T62_25685 [Paenibacillus donghaensis]